MKILKVIVSFIVILTIPLFCISVSAAGYSAYVYSFDGKYKDSLPMFAPEKLIEVENITGDALLNPSDLVCDDVGNIYICDNKNNRIIILSQDYKLIKIIKSFEDATTKKKDSFNFPSGIFVDKSQNLYIADTENKRIVVLDKNGAHKETIVPKGGNSVPKSFNFKPTKLVCDNSGRLYITVSGSNLGIVCLNENGSFEGFLGAQLATPTAGELFWRLFMTKAQIARTAKIIPVEHSNLTIDKDGFIFVTSSALNKDLQYNALLSRSKLSDYAPIKRLNPNGDDVLSRMGFYPPAGDIEISGKVEKQDSVSAFSDVTVDDLGVYSVLDTNQNKIFIYNTDGTLLNVFGGEGMAEGQFLKPSAICNNKDKLLILDSEAGTITEFKRTSFGENVFNALTLQSQRKYEKALKVWQNIAKSNINLDFVYINIGKSYMLQGKNIEAMENFKLVNDKADYSKAFKMYRNDLVKKYFFLIPVVVILLLILALKASKHFKRVNKEDAINSNLKITTKKELIFSFYTIFHPLDGFYDLKRYKRGGIKGAIIIFILTVVTVILRNYQSGFAFLTDAETAKNPFTNVVSILLPIVVFSIANWCVSSFMDGEGRFKDIFIVVCYSLLPIVLLINPITVLTNFFTIEEGQVLLLFESLAYFWAILLMFFGTLSIHGYSFSKNILSSILSLLAMVIIIFLMILCISLFQKSYTFIQNIVEEILFRF